MIKLKFILDDHFLASYIIANYHEKRRVPYVTKEHESDIINFQNLAWAKSKELCKFLDKRGDVTEFVFIENKDINLDGLVRGFISDLVKTPEFKTLKKQTEESIKKCENEWNENFPKTEEYIMKMGVNLSGTFTIWMAHPGIKAGHYIGNNNLKWSYQTYWPNYNTVYLWHEMLHSHFEFSTAAHSLIEFLTDEQMRVMLNGGNYPPFVGHDFLKDFKLKALPIWREFLNAEKKDISNLLKSFKEIE